MLKCDGSTRTTVVVEILLYSIEVIGCTRRVCNYEVWEGCWM